MLITAAVCGINVGVGTAITSEYNGEMTSIIGSQSNSIIWNASNFDGFDYGLDGTSTETLNIAPYTLSGPDTDRTIDVGNLTYSTSAIWTEYPLHNDLGLNVVSRFDTHAGYQAVFLNGTKYVTISNNSATKLAQLLIEFDSDDVKTLRVGEKWDVGGRYTIRVLEIDINGTDVWIQLEKNGGAIRDFVISTKDLDLQNRVWTYNEDVAGEFDIPILSLYVSGIMNGENSNYIQIKYLSLIDDNILQMSPGDRFSNMELQSTADSILVFSNWNDLTLNSSGGTFSFIGNISFVTLNNASSIEFYPQLIANKSVSRNGGIASGNYDYSWNLPEGYTIVLQEIDLYGTKALFTLLKDDVAIDQKILTEHYVAPVNSDSYYSYTKNGTELINMTLNLVFRGNKINSAQLVYVYQHSEIDGSVLLDNGSHMYKSATSNNIVWELQDGYNLTLNDISLTGDEAWFELSKNGVAVKGEILNEAYANTSSYTSGIGSISYSLGKVLQGAHENVVAIKDIYQYSDGNGTLLISNDTHLYKTGDPVGISWVLPNGYVLAMKDIDILPTQYSNRNSEKVWFELSRDGVKLAEDVIQSGDRFTYVNNPESFDCVVTGIMHDYLTDVVKINGAELYSDLGVRLVQNDSHTYFYRNPSGGIWELFEGYSLNPKMVSVNGNKVWLSLEKDGIVVKDEIINDAGWFNYSNSTGALVFSTYVSGIFSGYFDLVTIKNTLQYSEINGRLLLQNPSVSLYAGTTFITNASQIVNHTSSGLTSSPISFVRFNFSRAMHETSFSLAEDIVSFTGPNGNVKASGYNWLNSHTLEVTFESQYTLGEYEMVIGPEIFDLGGNAMNQDGDQIPGEIPDDRYIATFNYAYSPTTDVIMNETGSSTHALYESVIIQNATLNTSVIGDFSGTLNFTNLEITLINSGSFTEKGFSKGIWSANIEGNSYIGDWKGMLFKKPDERKIHLKGEVSGDLKGIVEGYFVESVNGSDIYDQYQATWTISQIGADIVFAKLDLNGTVNHLESNEYSSELYALQTSIDGEASGYYNRSLSMVLTHVRIDNETNPNYGQGFSIISYVSESGSGEVWTYDNLISPNVVKMNGISSDPLTGIVSGTLDESTSSRTVTLSIGRIDVGLPPATDLKIMIDGRKRVSPGGEILYTIEIINHGTLSANNLSLTNTLSPFVEFKNAGAGIYSPENHSVFWGIEELKPSSKETFFVTVKSLWGLSDGTIIKDSACIKDPPLNNTFYPGINWAESNRMERNKQAFDLDSTLRLSYFNTNLLTGAIHVWLASINIFTPQNYVDIAEGNGQYSIAFSHSGGTYTLFRKIKARDVIADYAVFVAPALLDQNELENLPVKKVIIVQSTDDILYRIQIRIERNHDFSLIPDGPAITVLNSPAHEFLENRAYSLNTILWLTGIDLNQNQIPENESFWIGGRNRDEQELFSPSNKIIVITRDYSEDVTAGEAHSILLQELIQMFINKVPPFDGRFEGLEKIESPEDECSTFDTVVTVAHDPNIKYGPEGFISPIQKLNYTVEYENEGEGIAFGVYFTDILDSDLDYTTLEIGPVKSTIDDSIIAPPGEYNPATRTIVWFVGEVGPKEGGYANISVNVRSDAAEGTEVINYATVYFPSVPEETRTNGIVSIVDVTSPRHSNVNQSDSAVFVGEAVEVYAYWQDGVQLNYTWLETNESGIWQNVSYSDHSRNEAWSIFTISTIQEGEVCWRIHAKDTAGNENVTQVQCFNVKPDKTPPHSITNPTLQAAGTTWLNWTWTNPSDPDFNHTEVYLNGIFITNIPAPLNYYNATGLLPDTSYELSTRTMDTSGNINQTWVNDIATTTKPLGDFSDDGITDAWDITYLARHIAGIPGYEALSSGDVSGDGAVDVWDCTYLARAIAGIPGYNV